MIVWFNNKITNIPVPGPGYQRYSLRKETRFDIAKYCFASYMAFEPLVSKYIFTLEMADEHAGREAEMEEYLRNLVPADKLVIRWHRCNYKHQWLEIKQIIDATGDKVIYPAGNEDHIFIDSNIDIIKEGIEILANEQDAMATIMTSCYPEFIRVGYKLGAAISNSKNYIHFNAGCNDSIRIMKKELFDTYLDIIQDPNFFFFRTEQWNATGFFPMNKMYHSTKEQFRHFEGYSNTALDPNYCPPLEIPPRFFEKDVTIRYGFQDRDADCVNINPLAATLYAVDPINGADYRFTLDDIPAFWKPYIKQIIVAPNIDEQAMITARDRHYVNATRGHFNNGWLGNFGDGDFPSMEWLNNHMIGTKV